MQHEHMTSPSVGDVAASTGMPDPGEVQLNSPICISNCRSHETGYQSILLDRPKSRNLQASKVPSSRIGRLFHYGGVYAFR